ncbi:MAG: ASCH domain-containing protein [Pyrobaculum sp.]
MVRDIELGPYLRFKQKFIKRVIEGEKKVTIRYGVVKPRFNFVYIVCCDEVYGEAIITKVVYTRLSRVGEDLARADGFESREELINELNEIYGELDNEDVVSIIYFTVVRVYNKPVALSNLRGG